MLSNINAILAVASTIKSTLGPRGMDKLIVDGRGAATISNDGATIMKLLEIVHPAAKLLVEIARSQDAEVGDGTTSVVLFAAELLKEVKTVIEDNLNPQIIIKAFRNAAQVAIKKVHELAVGIPKEGANFRELLERCAATSMNSKIISHQKEFFKTIVVDAVLSLEQSGPDALNEKMIGIKKVAGGGMQDSMLVKGVAFKRTFSYAGFEQQPRKIVAPKIICLNVELELKAERANAEVRIEEVSQYQAIVNAEWTIIFEKLDLITGSGANVVLSKLPIGDLATQYFADRGIFCAGRVPSDDLERVVQAVGGSIQSSVNSIKPEYLGTCAQFEEVQIGGERYNLFTGCDSAKTCTLILRGGSEQFIGEVERSLHDAIMITKRVIKYPTVVAGGGAVEMELSKSLKEYANIIQGKQQIVVNAFAKAFEVIPRQLCENAGLDTPAVLSKLRKKHAVDGAIWTGVNLTSATGTADNYEKFIWEPALVKVNMIAAATEAAIMILSVDETIKAPVPDNSQPQIGR